MKRKGLLNLISHKSAAKAIALACATTLMASTVMSYQVEAEKQSDEDAKEQEDTLTDTLSDQIINTSTAEDTDKDETVYVFTDANGNTDHILVSDWLKNKNGDKTIKDSSSLSDIDNVKGDETFSGSGDNMTWQADGEDIYYQGTSKQQSPVSVKVTYYLNDKEVSPKEIAGKSGSVKIRFDYTNNETKEITVNDKKETIHIPFVVLSGLVLSNDNFKNVTVTNGKVISEGNNTIIAGVAMPGLKDSLQLDDKDLDADLKIPEYVEVSADTTNFKLDMTMSMVLSDIMDQLNFDDSIDTSDLSDNMNQLTDATSELLDGTGKLKDGTGTLKEKVGEFNSGLITLNSGITDYTSGVSKLSGGISELKLGTGKLAGSIPQLKKGVGDLKDGSIKAYKGADKLVAGYAGDGTEKNPGAAKGAKALASGAEKISTNLKTAATGAANLKAGAAIVVAGYEGDGTAANPGLAKGAAQVAGGLALLNTSVANLDLPKAEASEEQTQEVALLVGQALHDPTNAAQIQQAAMANTENSQAASAALVAAMKAELDQLAASGTISMNGIDSMSLAYGICTNAQVNGAVKGVAGNAVNQAAETIATVGASTASTATLDAVNGQIDAMRPQIDELKGSVAQLSAGATGINLGINGYTDANGQHQPGLYEGTKQIEEGIGSINDGTSQLSAGAVTLAKGANDLNKGINGYTNAKGEKVVGLYNGTKTLEKGLKELKNGLATLDSKSVTLAAGVAELDQGADKLNQGAITLNSNSKKLTDGSSEVVKAGGLLSDGVDELDQGANDLNEGMIKFNEEGIKKLTDAFSGDIDSLLDRLDAIMNAGKEYNNFSGVAEGKKSSVKFIIKTEAVKAE